jgi:cytochrome P450
MGERRIPPGPKGHWLGGNLPDFRRDRLQFLVDCARRYGDVAAVRLAHRRVYLVSHPDLVEDILVTQSKHFIKHFALRLNPLLLGNGLLTSEGDFWLRQRRLIQPVFNRQRIAGYAADMVAAARRVTADWRPGERRDMMTEMMRLTLDVAAKTLFGAEVGGSAGRVIVDALQLLQDNFLVRFNSLMPVPVWVPTPANLQLKRAVRRLDDILYGFIRQRRGQGTERGDLLSLLLQARDEAGGRMTDKQLRDEAMTLFLAGHETTALALSWTWYLLAQHPEAERRLAEEVQSVLAGREPAADDYPRLKYAEGVALEAMRLYPPAYVVGREALVDCEVGGFHVPRGTTCLMSQWVVQRDPRFFAEPEAFRPERWGAESIKALPKFAYFPFGGGPRLCIGNTFAMMELVLVLAVIARQFRFRLQPGHDVSPQPTFTLRPLPGIPGVIELRNCLPPVMTPGAAPRDRSTSIPTPRGVTFSIAGCAFRRRAGRAPGVLTGG